MAQGWDKSNFGNQSLGCLALVEVIDFRKEPKSKVHDHGSIYVVEDETLVVTRCFFVYAGSNGYKSVNANNLKVPDFANFDD